MHIVEWHAEVLPMPRSAGLQQLCQKDLRPSWLKLPLVWVTLVPLPFLVLISQLVKMQSMQHEPVLLSKRVSVQNVQSDWRLEQVQQLILDSRMHCRTVEKTLNKNKHGMQQAQRALQALQGV